MLQVEEGAMRDEAKSTQYILSISATRLRHKIPYVVRRLEVSGKYLDHALKLYFGK